MFNTNTIDATKKLAFKFILDNIEYRKKCLYLQEIISMGRVNQIWQDALILFFDSPLQLARLKAFSKN